MVTETAQCSSNGVLKQGRTRPLRSRKHAKWLLDGADATPPVVAAPAAGAALALALMQWTAIWPDDDLSWCGV